MSPFETGNLVTGKPSPKPICGISPTNGAPVAIPVGSLGVVLWEDGHWISVLFAYIGSALWVHQNDLIQVPPEAPTEPENIQNTSQVIKTVQGP